MAPKKPFALTCETQFTARKKNIPHSPPREMKPGNIFLFRGGGPVFVRIFFLLPQLTKNQQSSKKANNEMAFLHRPSGLVRPMAYELYAMGSYHGADQGRKSRAVLKTSTTFTPRTRRVDGRACLRHSTKRRRSSPESRTFHREIKQYPRCSQPHNTGAPASRFCSATYPLFWVPCRVLDVWSQHRPAHFRRYLH